MSLIIHQPSSQRSWACIEIQGTLLDTGVQGSLDYWLPKAGPWKAVILLVRSATADVACQMLRSCDAAIVKGYIPRDLFTHNNNVERCPIAGKHFLIEQKVVAVISEAGSYQEWANKVPATSPLGSVAPRPQHFSSTPISNPATHSRISIFPLINSLPRTYSCICTMHI